jgi:GT2 family glycosyltransferase
MTPSAPTIISVILNTNRRDDTLACLGSLSQTQYPANQALVVDNGSTDGSVAAINAAFPATQVLSLTENRGYAGNNNVGITWALAQGADWVFVLNEDTILAKDCLTRLVAVGEGDPRIGIVGPMVYHFDEPTVIQSAGGRLGPSWSALLMANNEPDTGQFRQPRPVEWISGCAMLIRRGVLEQIGLFDERFFIYWEEIDLCVRARAAGWQLLHVPQAGLWHKGVKRDYRPTPAITYYTTRNLFLLLQKNHAPPGAWLRAMARTLRTLLSWSLKPKWRAMRPHRDAMLRGLLDFARRRWGPQPTPGSSA